MGGPERRPRRLEDLPELPPDLQAAVEAFMHLYAPVIKALSRY